jgi:NADH-quinone oxidoreductase subunit L
VFWTFLIGSASLAAVPLITAGFYSKDQILWLGLAGENGSIWLYLVALLGAFVTSIYTFRMVFITFFGESKTEVSHMPGFWMKMPLVVLAILSLAGGFIELPHNFAHFTLFTDYLKPVLPVTIINEELAAVEWMFQILAAVVALSGIFIAYLYYLKKPHLVRTIERSEPAMALHRFWHSGWGFDTLYDYAFVRPYVFLSKINKGDFIDWIYKGITSLAQGLNQLFARTQTGMLRTYMLGVLAGALLILTISLLL